MANVEKIKKELDSIESFKNVTLTYNEEKNIYDIYSKIKGDNEDTIKDILNNINDLDYTYCSSGIFEYWFSPENSRKVIKELKKNF